MSKAPPSRGPPKPRIRAAMRPARLGYARLNRGSIILDNVIDVSAKRWNRFTASLRMDEMLAVD